MLTLLLLIIIYYNFCSLFRLVMHHVTFTMRIVCYWIVHGRILCGTTCRQGSAGYIQYSAWLCERNKCYTNIHSCSTILIVINQKSDCLISWLDYCIRFNHGRFIFHCVAFHIDRIQCGKHVEDNQPGKNNYSSNQ